MQRNTKQLQRFLDNASQSGYAADGTPVKAWNPGNTEFEFTDGKWLYRDSYSGFMQSWGKETIWFDGAPVWTQSYGGGIEKQFRDNKKFADEVFRFLQLALQQKPEGGAFQPRGPELFTNGNFEYHCSFRGNISSFSGEEVIGYKKQSVFTHQFFGGLVLE